MAIADIGPYEYCCAVATKPDLIKQDKSYVYPNPSRNQITLISAQGIPDKIILKDLSGDVLIETNPSKQQTNLNVSFLNKGVYIIQVHNRSKSIESIKFVKY